jgi:hypothetical protein
MKRERTADPYRDLDVIDARAPRFNQAAVGLLATGLCAGCEIYRIGARLRGVRSHRLDRIDLTDLGVAPNGEVVVQFTHPLCSDCRALELRLREEGRAVVTVDVSRRPELARRYGVALVPTAVAVSGTGAVVSRLAG